MATVNSSSVVNSDPIVEAQRLELAKYENSIEATIRRTASLLKTTDFFQGCLLLVVWSLAFVLAFVFVDAWLWQLNSSGRLLALVGLVGGGLYVVGRWMAPMVLARINPLYAAKVIEDGHPTLKNSLVNYVSLTAQAERPNMKKGVMEAVTRRAAIDASRIPREQSIDYSSLIRVMYLLTGVMVLFAVYWMLSPRSPLQSIARLLSPFSDMAAPTRVEIRQIDPPGGSVVVGNTLTITALISGMLENETPVFVYDSVDGQAVGASTVMVGQTGAKDKFEGQIKTGEQGVQSSFDFRIVAGDAVSRSYRVLLEQRPTLVLDRVDLKFPAYSELPPQTVIGQGDLRVLEGTELSVFAHSNVPIKKAWLELYDLPADREVDNDMTQKLIRNVLQLNITDDTKAQGMITATLDVQGKPRYTHYRLLMQDLGERTSRLGPIYKLDVVADEKPEVKWLWPQTAEYSLAIDESLDLRFQATDPDFRLTKLTLHVSSRRGRSLVHPVELGEQSGRGVVLGQWQLKPREFGLEPGDEVIAFVQAEDNRHSPPTFQLNSNISRTENLRITIAEPIGIKPDPNGDAVVETESPPADPGLVRQPDDVVAPPEQKGQENDEQPIKSETVDRSELPADSSADGMKNNLNQDQPADGQPQTPGATQPANNSNPSPSANPEEQPDSKDKEADEVRQAWKNDPPSKPGDAKHDGDVMQRIRQFMEKENAAQNPSRKPEGQTDQQPGQQNQGENQGGQTEQQSGQPGQQNQGEQTEQQSQPGQSQPGQSQPGQSQPGQSQPGQSQPGQSQPGQSQPGQSQSEQSQPGQSQPGQSQPGQSQPGQSQPGQSQPGQSQPGQSQPGQSQPGQSQPGQSQPEQSQPGQSQSEQSQPGQSQPGQSQSGQSQSEQSQPGQSQPEQSQPGQSQSEQSQPGQSQSE
ncbi:MAG: hypothetical protein Q8M16_09590, partial [Pirellulaceae bacterium]|nr:hypothetical protein [Pirellulaceae bacterium]